MILIMKCDLIVRSPTDWDEGIYLYLSEHMGWTLGQYSVAGSAFESSLAANVYSSPVFYHPPLIPFAIKCLSLVWPPVVAAKILNLALVFVSYVLLYRIALALSDARAALITLALWTVCPLFNMESSLIHLDFPMTVLMLAGIWAFLSRGQEPGGGRMLLLSALAFDLAMLTKYTSPLYVLVPLFLAASDPRLLRDKRATTFYLAMLIPGFAWWLYVAVRFGTLLPAVFLGNKPGAPLSPFMQTVSARTWYDIWFYYAGMCPLFLMYLWVVASWLVSGRPAWLESAEGDRGAASLVALNASVILCTVLFSVINSMSNGIWMLRHVLPLFPVIYITLGHVISRLMARRDPGVNAWLATGLLFNLAVMSFSTMLNLTGIRAIPALFFWIPGLRDWFH